jgi:hypothetical protein
VHNFFVVSLKSILFLGFIFSGTALMDPAQAVGNVDVNDRAGKQLSKPVSISHLKLRQWHVFALPGYRSGDVENVIAQDVISQSWYTFGRQRSPYGSMEFRVLSNWLLDSVEIQSEGTDKDNFFWVQAAWESVPMLPVSTIEDEQVRISFPEHLEKPHQLGWKSERMFVHLIPAGVLRLHPDLFTQQEIEKQSNCFEIANKFADSAALQAFRTEWVEFWRTVPNPSREQVLKESAELGTVLKLQLR